MECINILKDDQYEEKEITHSRSIARAILINEKNEVCLLHLIGQDDFGNRNYYETPGGGVNDNESLKDAVIREVKEETGYESEIICELGLVKDYYNLIGRENLNYYFLLKATNKVEENLDDYEKTIIKEKVWVNFDKAVYLYEKMNKEKLEILVQRRELPILLMAKKIVLNEKGKKRKPLARHLEIEREIMTSFRSRIWSKFTKAITEYKLLKENDHIAVCISGGKDSMILAKCMQLLEKYGDVNFKCTYMVMNPGYNEKNKQKIIDNAKILNIPIIMYDTDIFDVVASQTGGSPCYLCARMRRGALYKKAEELGCNKIALGHHFDDVIETTMMSMLYGGKIQSMMPKLHSDNFEGLELIRPLFYVREKDIIAWCKKNELEFIRCACHFTEKVASGELESKRKEIKLMLANLRTIDKNIDMNIFKSMYNVNVDTAIAYQLNTVTHHFLENYDEPIDFKHNIQFERTEMMLGNNNMEKIYKTSVAIFGIGGVGGHVVESLARSGISTFYLYDPDIVSISNINRQVMATFKTIGKDKVTAMKEKILSINPNADVHTYKMFIDKNNINEIDFSKFDYCIDALDTISTKILLIIKGKENNVPLISAMGAGNKMNPNDFKVMDLSKTTNDPIARVLRRELKNYGITHQKVVCSTEIPTNKVVDENGRHIPASSQFAPAGCGILIASEVIKDIINS